MYQGSPFDHMPTSFSNPYHPDWRSHPNYQWMDSNEQQCFYDGGSQEIYPEFYQQDATSEFPNSAYQQQQVQQPTASLDTIHQMLHAMIQQLDAMESRMVWLEAKLDQVVCPQNQQIMEQMLQDTEHRTIQAPNRQLAREDDDTYQLILEEEEEVEPFVIHEEVTASPLMATPMPQGNCTHSSIHVSTNSSAPCLPFPNRLQRPMKEVHEAASHKFQRDRPCMQNLPVDALEDLYICRLFEDKECTEEDLPGAVELVIEEMNEDVPTSHSVPLHAPPIKFMEVEHIEMVIGAHIRTDKEILLLMFGCYKKRRHWRTRKKRRPFMCYLAKHSLSPKLLSKEHATSLMNAKLLMEHVAEFLTFEEVCYHSLAAGL